MLMRKLVWGAVIGTLLALSAGSAVRAQGNRRFCVFDTYAPRSVVEYKTNADLPYAMGSYLPVRGAQLYIPARPGLTAEWLDYWVHRSLSSQDGCGRQFGNEVDVGIWASGPGFWVTLTSADDDTATAVYHWATTFNKQQ